MTTRASTNVAHPQGRGQQGPKTGGGAVSPDGDEVHESAPTIEVSHLVVRYGDVVAVDNVSFDVRRGEHLTLLGPSGCGKTTMLRSIAGLERPSSGVIRIDGKATYSSGDGINISTEKRGISMVFQSYGVWPHMTVFDNVAYGLRVRNMTRAVIEEKVDRALALVQMSKFARRSATKLSGGQQQRVALARALAFSPSVVLFDEPLSNLDAKLRNEMRLELRELQQKLKITSVYVTHDQEEALAISDRVIVMNAGCIEQIGAPEDIYDRPRTAFIADFVGSANIINGRVCGEPTGVGCIRFECTGGLVLQAYAQKAPTGKEQKVAIRTAYIQLAASAFPIGNNSVRGCISRRIFHGDFIQYLIDWPAGQLVVRRPPTDVFSQGTDVAISFAPEHCVLLEA